MSRLTKCNFCTLAALQKFADDTQRKLTTEPHPVVGVSMDGVDVLIGGVLAAWLAKLPTECHCND